MLHTRLTCLVAALLIAALPPAFAADAPMLPDAGFTSLFDGKTMTVERLRQLFVRHAILLQGQSLA